MEQEDLMLVLVPDEEKSERNSSATPTEEQVLELKNAVSAESTVPNTNGGQASNVQGDPKEKESPEEKADDLRNEDAGVLDQSKSEAIENVSNKEESELMLELTNESETHAEEHPSNSKADAVVQEKNKDEAIKSSNGREKNQKAKKELGNTSNRSSTLSSSSSSDLYSDGSTSSEEVFEVEAIVGDKLVKGKTFFKIRWQNYGPKDDTWEPEENLAPNPNLIKTIEAYWEEKKQEKQKKDEVKKELPKQPKVVDEVVERNEEEQDDGEDQETWYGIKPDEGSREARRLFVADRVPTATEKVRPGVRVLRNQLRFQATDQMKSESIALSTPTRRSRTSGISRKTTTEKSESGTEEGDKSEKESPPPKAKEGRGRPKKKPSSENLVSRIKASQLGDVFTCDDNLEEKKKAGKGQSVTTESVKEEPQKQGQSSGQEKPTKFSRKRARGSEEMQANTSEESTRAKPHVGESGDRKPGILKHTKGEQITSNKSLENQHKVSSKGYHFVPSPRPTSARPPATLTKAKQEAIKRPLPRSEPSVGRKPAGISPSKPRSSIGLSSSSSSSSSKKLPVDEKWTAKQKRFHSLDLPLPVNKSTNLAEFIAHETKRTELISIQLSQQEFEEAVMDGKVDKVRAALRADKAKPDVNGVDGSGRTLLHKVCEVKCGMTHTQCELIDILVSSGARMDAKETTTGQIPLHAAIASRRLCHVRKLISLRSPINTADYSDQPPIVTAFNCSDAEFINALLNAGATFQPAFRAKPATNKHLLKRVICHQTRLQTAFDFARQTITSNMTAKPVSPIFVNPLYETREIEHSFRMEDTLLPGPNSAFMVFTCLSDFSTERLNSRMWGWSPVVKVSVNNRDCRLLQENSKFVFLAALRNGFNMLNLELNPSQCDSIDLKLLTQVFLVQLNQKGGNGQQPQQQRPIAPVQPTMMQNMSGGSTAS